MEKFENKDLKIAILIISSTNTENPRWKMEKEKWKKYMNKNKNIDCYFIECGNLNKIDIKNNLIKSKCQDSFIPGIYHKTLLSLEQIQDKYDFYIRTNLSTFINFEYLTDKLNKLDNNKPVYTGLIAEKKFISGCCIIMNNKTVNTFVKNGKKELKNNNLYDDVVIGKLIMENLGNILLDYEDINWRIDIENNDIKDIVKKMDKKKIPFVRCLNPKNIDQENKNLDYLINNYYA